jgi:hypothetical protein
MRSAGIEAPQKPRAAISNRIRCQFDRFDDRGIIVLRFVDPC